MAKVNPQTMKTQYDGQYDTFCRKNHDYGNSFEESLDQFGIVASIVRMSDKMKRLESLTDESKTQQVGSESLLDTLEDLSNYAAMTACWLKGIREEDGETEELTIYADNKPVITFTEDNENVGPENYIINMLSNIFRVVRMKIDKDEMLVPMDIYDDAGLIAKCIIESNTKQEGVAVINKYMCNHKDIPYELKDWIYGVIMRYLYYLEKEQTEDGDEDTVYSGETPVAVFRYGKVTKLEGEKKLSEIKGPDRIDKINEIIEMLKKILEFNYKIEWNRMTEDECVELKEIMYRLGTMVTEGSISEELMLDLINTHIKFKPESTINRLFNQIEELKEDNEDAVKDVITLLNGVFKIYCKMEEFKEDNEDRAELEHIKNRLRSMVNDGTISEELMRKLIDIHVKLNPDVLLFQLFNRKDDTPATPTEVPEAIEKYWEEQKRLVDFLLANDLSNKVSIPDDVMEDLKDPVEEKEDVGDKILKAIIWLLPLNKEY